MCQYDYLATTVFEFPHSCRYSVNFRPVHGRSPALPPTRGNTRPITVATETGGRPAGRHSHQFAGRPPARNSLPAGRRARLRRIT
ncbi:hypothetical protein KCH_35770 [Kitasatospora cheerisanensis KCTC 2395]|uniref:Uncharacterized protein n=1 Tax=Kitasatospora cheerisanensis KCTC 2395 TaxID=1348663 RepID=A0A066YU37_9ACTN|nr:hypothetical protein KCH_35770 [Kitasatospora cheerisanensis KCTC 2395]